MPSKVCVDNHSFVLSFIGSRRYFYYFLMCLWAEPEEFRFDYREPFNMLRLFFASTLIVAFTAHAAAQSCSAKCSKDDLVLTSPKGDARLR